MILAIFLAAFLDAISFLAPAQTIFPDANTSAVALGTLILMITAENRFGLYSVFRALRAIWVKSSLH